MNWEHLRTFLWLQSRITANKSKRAGSLSSALHTVIVVLAVIVGIASFAGSLAAGLGLLRDESPTVLLYVWDGLIAVFMFVWLMTLSIDLQRSELLPLEKFLHYPVSISGLFLINYAASILSEHVAMCLFIPAMFGLAVGIVLGKGAGMLLLFPLLISFLLMVTAVTYQFRGWLAVLMMNKRHRRTVLTAVTVSTMLIFQLPWLSSRMFGSRRGTSPGIFKIQQLSELAPVVNMVVPLGWLPYGAMASSEGRMLPPLLGIVGMTFIGAVSLRRSYRTTMRLYTGNYGSGRTRAVPKLTPAAVSENSPVSVSAPRARSLVDWEIPWISEQAATVTLSTLRSLLRAPEAKMVLLSPVILTFVFGAPMMRFSANPSEYTRPLVASGALLMILLSVGGLAMNQFAYDRSGFRNYVLAPSSRKDILLGKNLALAPVTFALSAMVLTLLQWFVPMRIDHLLGLLCQAVTMYLLFSMFSNFVAILNPTAIAAGSMRPAVRPTFKTLIVGFFTLFLFPMAVAPAMIPLGLEFALHWFGRYTSVPVFLLLSILEVIGVAWLYFEVLKTQGRLLQSRELKILEVVTARSAEG